MSRNIVKAVAGDGNGHVDHRAAPIHGRASRQPFLADGKKLPAEKRRPNAGGLTRLGFVDVAAERLRITCQGVQVHGIDVVLVCVDEHASGEGKLALLVVHEQQAVVPAVGSRLVHDRGNVAAGCVEIPDVEKRRVVLITTPQQGPVLDNDFAIGSHDRRSARAVHTLSVHNRSNVLLLARLRIHHKERLKDRLIGEPFADITQLCFIRVRLFHQCEVLYSQLGVFLFRVAPARKVPEDFLDHIVKDRSERIQ